MVIFQSIILFILFLVELAALAALGYWGFHVDRGWLIRFVLGIGTPLVVAVFWGLFVAPKATFPVTIPVRFLLQLAVFTLAAIALYASGKTSLAIGFMAVALIELVLTRTIKI